MLLWALARWGLSLLRIEGKLRLCQFVKYGIVGCVGVVVDTIALHILVSLFAFPLLVGKLLGAEIALLHNFFLNDVWSFGTREDRSPRAGRFHRLLRFHVICLGGFCLAALALLCLHQILGLNMYIANVISIGIATAWNFGLNAIITWPSRHQITSGSLKVRCDDDAQPSIAPPAVSESPADNQAV